MTATVCRCIPSPHRHINMAARHTSASLVAAESPVLFARYPLPPPPSHSHLSYLHNHPFSSHFSLYSDSLPRPSSSRPVSVDSYDSLQAARSLADDLDTIQRESARRLDELLVVPSRHSAADTAAASVSSGMFDATYPSPLPSPPQHSSPPLPVPSPPPSGLSSPLLALVSLHSRRLSSRALGLLLSLERQPSCPICLSGLVVGCEVSVLHCGHCLHTQCLLPWLRKSGACPMCRARVRPDQPKCRSGTEEEKLAELAEDEAETELARAEYEEEEQRRWRRRWAQNATNDAGEAGLRDWRYA